MKRDSAMPMSKALRTGRLILLAGLLAVLGQSHDAAELLKPAAVSGSGRFVAHDNRSKSNRVPIPNAAPRPDEVFVEPDSLLISAERFRSALESVIPDPGGKIGKIHVVVNDGGSDGEIVIVASLRTDVWHFEIGVPERVSRMKLARGIVSALLLERANRNPQGMFGEPPLWMAEGMTGLLLRTMGTDPILQPAPVGVMLRTVDVQRGADRLRPAREALINLAPMTISELSFSKFEELPPRDQERFSHSSELLVQELLDLPHGKIRFNRALLGCSQYLNWQTGFHTVYQDIFPTPRHLEKWWSIVFVEFSGRDPFYVWEPGTTLEKLEEILQVPVSIRESPAELPVRRNAAIEEVIRSWPWARQQAVLVEKVNLLRNLRVNSAIPLVPLIDGYRLALERLLRAHDPVAHGSEQEKLARGAPEVVAAGVLARLRELDHERSRHWQEARAAKAEARAQMATP